MDLSDTLLPPDPGVGPAWRRIKLPGFGYVYRLKDCLHRCGSFKGLWGPNALHSIPSVLAGWLDFSPLLL